MSTKNLKEKRAAKAAEQARDDVKLYRLMVEFGLMILMICLVSVGHNNGLSLRPDITLIIVGITALLFAASAIFYVANKKKSSDESMRVLTPVGIFGNAAVLFFASLHYYLYYDPQLLTIALIAAAVLYFVHNIYGGSYFNFSLITGIGFLAIQTATKIDNSFELLTLILKGSEWQTYTAHSALAVVVALIAHVAAAVLPVIAIVYAIVAVAKDNIAKRTLIAVVLNSLIVLAGAVMAFVYPAGVIYAIFALIGYYLAVTVAYTVRMM